MKGEDVLVGCLIGVAIGVPLGFMIYSILKQQPTYTLPYEQAPPAGQYINEETYDVIEDANGNVARVVIHRNATRS